MIEIELRERLRRQREELLGKIESLGETATGGDSASEDLEARKRELNNLNGSIDELTKKAQGELTFHLPRASSLTIIVQR